MTPTAYSSIGSFRTQQTMNLSLPTSVSRCVCDAGMVFAFSYHMGQRFSTSDRVTRTPEKSIWVCLQGTRLQITQAALMWTNAYLACTTAIQRSVRLLPRFMPYSLIPLDQH
jgi:hypothetical protein